MASPVISPLPPQHDDAYVRWVSLVVLAGSVGPMLETTITSVAVGTLADEFHASVSSIQWVTTAYLLALAMVIPLTGWLVERFGARRTWFFALILFTVASLLCGAAWSTGSLIVFRILQGLGGGLTLPLAQTFIAQASGPQRFGRALAFVAVPAQLAPIIGPVVGGVLIAGLGWRWIFWINVPLTVAGLILAHRSLPETATATKVRLDLLGLLLLSPGLAAMLYGLSEASTPGGSTLTSVVLPLVIGAALVAAFCRHALHTKRDPLLDVRLFRVRSFSASTSATFLIGLSLFGAMFLLPLYEQRARGEGVVAAGLLLAPQGVGALLALLISPRLAERYGSRLVVLVGLGMTLAGTFVWGFAGDAPSQLLLELALVVRGGGIATAGVPAMAAAYLNLTHAAIPRATSALYSLQRLGGSVGTAALAVILQVHLTAARTSQEVAAAFGVTFRWSMVLTGLAIVPALLLPGRPAPAARPAEDLPAGPAVDHPLAQPGEAAYTG